MRARFADMLFDIARGFPALCPSCVLVCVRHMNDVVGGFHTTRFFFSQCGQIAGFFAAFRDARRPAATAGARCDERRITATAVATAFVTERLLPVRACVLHGCCQSWSANRRGRLCICVQYILERVLHLR